MSHIKANYKPAMTDRLYYQPDNEKNLWSATKNRDNFTKDHIKLKARKWRLLISFRYLLLFQERIMNVLRQLKALLSKC